MFNLLRIQVPSWSRIASIALLGAAALLGLIAYSPLPLWWWTPSLSETAATQRLAYLENEIETLNLAREFGFDPIIVDVTRIAVHSAFRDGQRRNKLTWRFVRSEQELTYLLLSLIQTESRGNPAAINSGSSATGLTQLLLSTARQYDRSVSPQELQTIPKHMNIAVRYFVDLLEKYNGNSTLAVIAWNRGPGTVDRAIALGNSPENGYARQVFMQAAMHNAKGN